MGLIVVVMVNVIIPLLVLTFLESCFAVIPPEHHVVHSKWVWLPIAPIACRLLIGILAPLIGPLPYLFGELLISLADVPIRAFVFIGLANSFSSYFGAKNINKGAFGKFAAWTVSLTGLGMLCGFVAALFWMLTHEFKDPIHDRPAWVILLSDGPPMIPSIYTLLLFVYLGAMNSLKGAVNDLHRRERIANRAAAKVPRRQEA